MDGYDHNAHSVFLLYYHLILVVKYRRLLVDTVMRKSWFMYIENRAREVLKNYRKKQKEEVIKRSVFTGICLQKNAKKLLNYLKTEK